MKKLMCLLLSSFSVFVQAQDSVYYYYGGEKNYPPLAQV